MLYGHFKVINNFSCETPVIDHISHKLESFRDIFLPNTGKHTHIHTHVFTYTHPSCARFRHKNKGFLSRIIIMRQLNYKAITNAL